MSDRNNKTECTLLLQERQKRCGNSLARLCGLRGSYAWRSVGYYRIFGTDTISVHFQINISGSISIWRSFVLNWLKCE